MTWELHTADCLGPEGMGRLGDKSVDHVICDPPFRSEIYEHTATLTNHQTTRSGTSPGMIVMKSGRIGSLDAVLSASIEHAARIARRWVVMFCDVESVGDVRSAMIAAGLRYVRTGAWIKSDPMPQFTGDRPSQGFEAVCIGHAAEPRKMRWNGGGKSALWHSAICKQNRPDHPCPKPVALMEALVRDFTDPGDLIADPFAGSGTTGVAAVHLGRRFVGWERDPKYCEIARQRLGSAKTQLRLIEEPPLARPVGLFEEVSA